MDLTKLTEGLVAKSFPELQGRKFIVELLNHLPDNSFMGARLQKNGDFLIFADKFSESYPEETQKRVLAHELAHMTRSIRRWPITEKLSQFLYAHFSPYKKYEEKRTEQLAALRGYKTPFI